MGAHQRVHLASRRVVAAVTLGWVLEKSLTWAASVPDSPFFLIFLFFYFIL